MNREAIKQAVARAGHGRSFMRRLPSDLGGGYFPASLEGGSKFLRRDLRRADPVLTDFARRYVKAGSRVWDIGANVGLFTFVAAGLAGPSGEVVAVEADTWLVGNLRAAALRNAEITAPVTVIPAAASSGFGFARFNIAANARATNYLADAGGSTTTGGVREVQTVITVPLDSMLEQFEAPDVVKIDVEGAELMVLEGAQKLLEHRPVLMLEAFSEHPDENLRIDAMLRSFGYTYFDAATGEPASSPTFNFVATVA